MVTFDFSSYEDFETRSEAVGANPTRILGPTSRHLVP
jgi:hypothetical protein